MTGTVTKEQAITVLQILTAEHGQEPYFEKADVIYNEGFYGVDLRVDGEKWRTRVRKEQVPFQINHIPVFVLVHG